MTHDIRWKQRFQNFERAFLFLERSSKLSQWDELQAAGMVQSFEFTFELAWKTLKDYLDEMGLPLKFPREVIKQAFQSELLDDGHQWLRMLDHRNELTHTYNQEQAQQAVQLICKEYYPALKQLYQKFKGIE